MNVLKLMSEGRIEGQRLPRKEVEGLPEAFRRGNRMQAPIGRRSAAEDRKK
jgi:hypothetical protein